MTERQEKICRLISQEIQTIKRKCENPQQSDYIYWYVKGVDGGDPLMVPMLELGVHNTRYRAK